MLPKRPKEFIAPTAKKLDASEELVTDVIDYYYSELRKALTTLKAPRIRVLELGVFRAIPNRVNQVIEKHTGILIALKDADIKKGLQKTREDLEMKLRLAKILKQKIDIIAKKRSEFYGERKAEKKAKKDLGQSKTDFEGIVE